MSDDRLEAPSVSQAELQAALHGTAAKLQQQLTEGRPDKLSSAKRRAGPGGAADRAAAVVHFASGEAGVPADRTALPRRPLHGLALRSSIAGRVANADSASHSSLESPKAGSQPSQKNLSSDGGSLAASVEAGMLAEQSDSTGKEPLQPLASAAARHASSAVSSPRGQTWTLGHTTVPRRLPPLTLSRQGTAGPIALLSGDWVSCHTERDCEWAPSMLLSSLFVCGESSLHVALSIIDMANHSNPMHT